MKNFFDAVRPHMRRGRLTASHVHGMEALIKEAHHDCNAWTAYVLATVDHETGQRFFPVREGFCRSNRGSINAVTGLYNKGIIRTNYALPAGPYGHAYYGRGLVQLTWHDNYVVTGDRLGIDLERFPDRMLEMDVSVAAIWDGMRAGTYRSSSLKTKLPRHVKPTLAQFRSARMIINGDTRRNGTKIAHRAVMFYNALEALNED